MQAPFPREVLAHLRQYPGNHKCCDCPSLDTDWGNINHGTFHCLECAGKHRSFGVQVSFIRSIYMDTWSTLQLEMMKQGGNGQIRDFFKKLNIENSPISTLYLTKAASHYRQRLKERVDKIMAGEIPSEPYRKSVVLENKSSSSLSHQQQYNNNNNNYNYNNNNSNTNASHSHSSSSSSSSSKRNPYSPNDNNNKYNNNGSNSTQNQFITLRTTHEFDEGSLGLTLTKDYKGAAIVSKLAVGGAAQLKGVHLGDTVVGVAGKLLEEYDEILHMVPLMPRPLAILFCRKQSISQPQLQQQSSSAASSSASPTKSESSSRNRSNSNTSHDNNNGTTMMSDGVAHTKYNRKILPISIKVVGIPYPHSSNINSNKSPVFPPYSPSSYLSSQSPKNSNDSSYNNQNSIGDNSSRSNYSHNSQTNNSHNTHITHCSRRGQVYSPPKVIISTRMNDGVFAGDWSENEVDNDKSNNESFNSDKNIRRSSEHQNTNSSSKKSNENVNSRSKKSNNSSSKKSTSLSNSPTKTSSNSSSNTATALSTYSTISPSATPTSSSKNQFKPKTNINTSSVFGTTSNNSVNTNNQNNNNTINHSSSNKSIFSPSTSATAHSTSNQSSCESTPRSVESDAAAIERLLALTPSKYNSSGKNSDSKKNKSRSKTKKNMSKTSNDIVNSDNNNDYTNQYNSSSPIKKTNSSSSSSSTSSIQSSRNSNSLTSIDSSQSFSTFSSHDDLQQLQSHSSGDSSHTITLQSPSDTTNTMESNIANSNAVASDKKNTNNNTALAVLQELNRHDDEVNITSTSNQQQQPMETNESATMSVTDNAVNSNKTVAEITDTKYMMLLNTEQTSPSTSSSLLSPECVNNINSDNISSNNSNINNNNYNNTDNPGDVVDASTVVAGIQAGYTLQHLDTFNNTASGNYEVGVDRQNKNNTSSSDWLSEEEDSDSDSDESGDEGNEDDEEESKTNSNNNEENDDNSNELKDDTKNVDGNDNDEDIDDDDDDDDDDSDDDDSNNSGSDAEDEVGEDNVEDDDGRMNENENKQENHTTIDNDNGLVTKHNDNNDDNNQQQSKSYDQLAISTDQLQQQQHQLGNVDVTQQQPAVEVDDARMNDQEEEQLYHSDSFLEVGMKVKIWRKGKWKSATVIKIHRNYTLKVLFKNGTSESHIPLERVGLTSIVESSYEEDQLLRQREVDEENYYRSIQTTTEFDISSNNDNQNFVSSYDYNFDNRSSNQNNTQNEQHQRRQMEKVEEFVVQEDNNNANNQQSNGNSNSGGTLNDWLASGDDDDEEDGNSINNKQKQIKVIGSIQKSYLAAAMKNTSNTTINQTPNVTALSSAGSVTATTTVSTVINNNMIATTDYRVVFQYSPLGLTLEASGSSDSTDKSSSGIGSSLFSRLNLTGSSNSSSSTVSINGSNIQNSNNKGGMINFKNKNNDNNNNNNNGINVGVGGSGVATVILVTKIAPAGQAACLGVSVGDQLIGMGNNGNSNNDSNNYNNANDANAIEWVINFEYTMEILRNAQYPITLVFRKRDVREKVVTAVGSGGNGDETSSSSSSIYNPSTLGEALLSNLGGGKKSSLLTAATPKRLANTSSGSTGSNISGSSGRLIANSSGSNNSIGASGDCIKSTKRQLDPIPQVDEYDVVFEEGEIGARLEERLGMITETVVTHLSDEYYPNNLTGISQPAQGVMKGVSLGCVVVGIGGERYISHSHTIATLKHSKRPITVRFRRLMIHNHSNNSSATMSSVVAKR